MIVSGSFSDLGVWSFTRLRTFVGTYCGQDVVSHGAVQDSDALEEELQQELQAVPDCSLTQLPR